MGQRRFTPAELLQIISSAQGEQSVKVTRVKHGVWWLSILEQILSYIHLIFYYHY